MKHTHASFASLLSCMQVIACGAETDDMAVTMTAPAETETRGDTSAEPSTTESSSATDPLSTADPSTSGTDSRAEASVEAGDRSDDPSDDGVRALGFGTHVWPIIDAECNCHKTNNPSGDLDLRADAAYDSLVGTPSAQDPGTLLVEPFTPHESYLLWKITGVQPVGGVMPPGAPLSEAELAVIEHWIAHGAEP